MVTLGTNESGSFAQTFTKFIFYYQLVLKMKLLSNLHSFLLMPVNGILCTYVEEEFLFV